MSDTNNQPMRSRTMPDCTILPVLGYEDVETAIQWLCRVFGFKERWRAGNHRSQLIYGNGVIVVIGTSGVSEPGSYTVAATHSLLVRVTDVEAHYAHSIKEGAHVLQSPTDYPYGERQYSVLDIGGHQWLFSQSIKDLRPEDWGGVTKDV